MIPLLFESKTHFRNVDEPDLLPSILSMESGERILDDED